MKKHLLKTSFYIHIIGLLYIIAPIICIVLKLGNINDVIHILYVSVIGRIIMLIIQISVIFLLVDNFIYFNKNDKNSNRLLLLILLNCIYSPIYFYKYRRKL